MLGDRIVSNMESKILVPTALTTAAAVPQGVLLKMNGTPLFLLQQKI